MSSPSDAVVDVLILGAGWTSQFLVPLLEKENLSYTLTTRTGKVKDCCAGKYDDSKILPFQFDAGSEDDSQYAQLPTARSVIITFKVEGADAARKLLETYRRTHIGAELCRWILLGSTGAYEGDGLHSYTSTYKHSPRTDAEDYVLNETNGQGAVLCLAGLWGDQRIPSGWVKRVASTKEKLKQKTTLHLIHGDDVARACFAITKNFVPGRWIVTDQQVYDWWALVEGWADDLERQAEPAEDGKKPEYKKWVAELMQEDGVTALPRDNTKLGRRLDSSHFWEMIGIQPETLLTTKGRNS